MSFTLSEDAERDVRGIYRYSIENFGVGQADLYFDSLEECFGLLGRFPGLGRDFSTVKRDARRHEHKSHSIYYRIADEGVFILRVLGSEQDPGRHL